MSNIIRIESKFNKNRTPIERLILAVSHAAAVKTRYVTGSHISLRCEHRPPGSKLAWKAQHRKLGIATIR